MRAAPPLAVVWDPRFRQYDFGPHHPFTERSRALAVRLLASSLEAQGSARVDWVRTVEPSPPGDLELFHAADYIETIRAAGERPSPTMLDSGDTPSFAGCFEAARTIVGGMVSAVDRVLDRGGAAFHPSGGLHHAGPARASGFCIFNDLGVGIAKALRRGRRVAYVDLDVHHGDGVMYGFYDTGRVLAIDFHEDGRGQFPGTGFPAETGEGDGIGTKINVPLPPGAGDEVFLPLFRRLVPPLFEAFRPELIVVQHGVDAHWGDALGRLQYTPAAYREALASLVELAQKHAGGRLVVTGGGGYRAATVARVLASAGQLLAGETLPRPTDPLPEVWRAEFEREFGEPAPRTWSEPPRLTATAWTPEHEEALVRQLEAALGQRFPDPAVRPGRGPAPRPGRRTTR